MESPTTVKRPRQTHSKKSNSYWCERCDRSFERSDHYMRHVHSHEDLRPYRCPSCPKAFNRGDLLYRHKQTHEGKIGSRFPSGRTSRACRACVQSKSKCTDEKPCRRCLSRGISCLPSGKDHPNRHSGVNAETTGSPKDPPGARTEQEGDCSEENPSSLSGLDMGQYEVHFDVPGVVDHAVEPRSTTPDPSLSIELPASSFLGGISFTDAFLPPSGSLEADYFDLDLDILQAILPSIQTHPRNAAGTDLEGLLHRNPPYSRFESFQKSPWLWTPVQFDHAYAGQQNLRLNEGTVDSLLRMQGHGGCHDRFIPTPVNSSSRDRILFMVHSTSKFAAPPPGFPSEAFLDRMVQVYFGWQNLEITSWIHAPSFSPADCIPELLALVVAAGASSISIPNVYRMGYALQERARLSLSASIEQDNSRVRDLQTIQSYLLWVSMGLWSGLKRNMELAESFLGAPVTMLRRYGCLTRSLYTPTIFPTDIDTGEALERKWHGWVKQESFKRATLFSLITDIQCSMAYLKPSNSSLAELSCPLPAARDLWLAPSAQAWKDAFLAKQHAAPSQWLTWLEIAQNPAALGDLSPYLDRALVALVIMHGFWSQVWAYQESQRFFRAAVHPVCPATTKLWLSCQHEELVNRIGASERALSLHVSDEIQLQMMAEFYLMSLNVSPREIQQFAGRLGEEEAATMNQLLRQWMIGPEFRTAVWHAGQILRLARMTPPAQLREILAVSVYQASLTLWAYGLMSRGMSNPGSASDNEVVRVFLDGPKGPDSAEFVTLGKGQPGISTGLEGSFAALSDIRAVMDAACHVYRRNFGVQKEYLPLLLDGLINLMTELGNINAESFFGVCSAD